MEAPPAPAPKLKMKMAQTKAALRMISGKAIPKKPVKRADGRKMADLESTASEFDPQRDEFFGEVVAEDAVEWIYVLC